MRRRLWLPLTAALLLSGAVAAQTAGTAPGDVAQGKYLVDAGDCAACHTAPGGADFAGGVVIKTPFGKLVGPNITPDAQTGIGGWSDAQFVDALKYGIGHHGRLYPGMPYIYFNEVPRDQILAMFAYLKTVPPVSHNVVADQLPFPFNQRVLMRGWNLLFFPDHGDYRPDPSQSAEWNRGAYLATGLEHCAACHTPKNSFGGDRTGREFTGDVVDGLNAPALRDSRANGLGTWSVDDIATYLKTGHNQFAAASGGMGIVVEHSTSLLTAADDHAIATYIHALPALSNAAPQPLTASDARMQAGARIYATECAACHTFGGTGQAKLFPSLVANPAVVARMPMTIVHVIMNGGQSVGTAAATAVAMPSFKGLLTDEQIADVATYIRNAWGNAAPAVSTGTVQNMK